MKKTLKKAFSLVLCMSMVLTLAAVTPEVKAAPKAKKITLNVKKKTLTVGNKVTLKVKKVKPSKASKKVTWKTSNKKVASVSKKGVVKAKAVGSAKITATATANKKVKATCKITVKEAKAEDTPVQPTANVPTINPANPTQNPGGNVLSTQEPAAEPTKTPRPSPTPFELPEDAMKDYASFDVGTVVNRDKTLDKSFTQLAAQQFDIVSFENEMKGYSLIDVGASQQAVATEGETVVKCQFGTADEMVQWAVDNGLKVRGHVLFWEQSMANAFFYQGYDENGELVDAETLKARMESYANQVIGHFEEKFPGEVVAWDVVNEAINADSSEKDETTGLYLNNTGNFYKILGGEYIKYAFEYAQAAKNAVNEKIKLFYNDFNCFQSPKTNRIVDLINYLNADEKLLDCMGMEGYVLTYWPNASEVKSAMEKFAGLGVKVGINELCVRLHPGMTKGNETITEITETNIADHAQKCEDMFKVYCEFNKAHPDTLTNVSIWALFDRPDLMVVYENPDSLDPEDQKRYDYDVYGTHSGLFDENYKAKDAFNRVIAVLKEYV